MIVNPDSLATVQAKWQGVVRMRERMRRLVASTLAFDTRSSSIFGNIHYNLPLLLAFEVLKQVLLQAKAEGIFTGSQQQLADLMDSAKTAVSWNDWECLREGVNHRNEVVNNGKLYGDIQCLHYIGDIEAQLVAWGILTPAQSVLPSQSQITERTFRIIS